MDFRLMRGAARARVLCVCIFAVSSLAAGCVPQLEPPDAARTLPGLVVAPGRHDAEVAFGQEDLYEVRVAAGQTLRVALRTEIPGALLTLGFVETPDGRMIDGLAGLRADESGTFSAIEGQEDGDGLRSLAFAARSETDGVWRFSVRGAAAADIAVFFRQAERTSVLEKALLLAFLFGNQPDFSGDLDAFGQLVADIYPQFDNARRTIAYTLVVMVGDDDGGAADAGESENPLRDAPDDSGDDGPPPSGDGDDIGQDGGQSGGNNDGTSGDGNGGSSGGSDDTGGGGNDGGSGGGNTGGNGGGGNSGGGNEGGGGNSGGNNEGGGGNNSQPPTKVDLTPIAETAAAVPDQPASATFTIFGDPIIDQDGRVAFWARYDGGDGNGGLYVWDKDVLRRVVDDSRARAGSVPGRSERAFFGKFRFASGREAPPIAWGAGGRLVFVADSRGDGASRGIYRWRASDGDLVRVVDMATLAGLFPDVLFGESGPTFSATFHQPGVSDDGVVSFAAVYFYFTQSRQIAAGEGLFVSNGVRIVHVVDTKLSGVGDVPGHASARFEEVGRFATLNPRGDVLFQAGYANGGGDTGVYMSINQNIVRVLDNGPNTDWPGLPSGAVAGRPGEWFDAIAMGESGEILVETVLSDGGPMRETVLSWNGSRWTDLTGGANSGPVDLLTGINRDGRCAILVGGKPRLAWKDGKAELADALPPELEGREFAWGTRGGAINTPGRVLLSYAASGSAPGRATGLALWTGERLLVVADASTGIAAAMFGALSIPAFPETDRPGRSGALNDRDELCFRTIDPGADGVFGSADDVEVVYIGQAR